LRYAFRRAFTSSANSEDHQALGGWWVRPKGTEDFAAWSTILEKRTAALETDREEKDSGVGQREETVELKTPQSAFLKLKAGRR